MPNRLIMIVVLPLGLIGLVACDSVDSPAEPEQTIDIEAATSPASTLALACSGCHSAETDAISDLTAHTPETLAAAMLAYKLDSDGTTVMHRLARGYSDTEIERLSAYIGGQGSQP